MLKIKVGLKYLMTSTKSKNALNPTKQQKTQNPAKREEKALSCSPGENFSRWYTEVLVKAEMIDYYDVSGCYILRPNSCFVWNQIRDFFNGKLKKLNVEEAYFPMFVSKTALEAEAAHLEGFRPEVAWVTKSGDSDLAVPLAIRPTSETIMYPAFKNWIRSHRDLPLRLNQWSNVVRWEFKNPTPFIRTREFLWQEGHSAFATAEEADKEVSDILDLYAEVYESLLAVPVIKGRKTDLEKFPGAEYTMTVEAFAPGAGRAIQSATSHGLGHNFARIFGIEFENEAEQKSLPFQNSWGLTTRSIGVMVMTHGDEKGLVMPPKVARNQAVVIPIFGKTPDADEFQKSYLKIASELNDEGVRAIVDDRKIYRPGWKYNHWEMQGVPLRIEFGPKDMADNKCVFVRRDTGEKVSVDLSCVRQKAVETLDRIQSDIFEKAQCALEKSKMAVTAWAQFEAALKNRCFAEAAFCGRKECEESVKERSKTDEKGVEGEASELSGAAKSLCVPLIQKALSDDQKCFACAEKAINWTLFGRSY